MTLRAHSCQIAFKHRIHKISIDLLFHGWIEVPTRGHILNSLCAYLQGAGWQKLRDHSVTSARYGPQHTLFCRDFMFCRDLCAFGELLPKGFTLSEGFQRMVSCFGEISMKGFLLGTKYVSQTNLVYTPMYELQSAKS